MSQELTTKEKILASARVLFVQNGFAGTSMGKIAKLAEINHSLLFHHFKNKENLWTEVKMQIAKDSNNLSKILPCPSIPFGDFLKKLFHNGINFYKKNPEIIRIINWQRLESNTHPAIGVTLSDEMQEWIRVFSEYQKKEKFHSSVKPEFIVTMVLAIVSSLAMDNYIHFSDDKTQESYINFCCNIIENYATKETS